MLGVVNDKLLIAAACFSYLRTECYILRFFPTGVDVKVTPSWDTLFVCGILCNVLVCLAVRIGFAARSVSDKVLGILLPIAGFVAMGFEHCVANMFFLPMGLVAKTFGFGADARASRRSTCRASSITCPQPRSAISSAALFVALAYWYLNGKQREKVTGGTA